MKTMFANGPWPKLQRHWDVRAACNFIGGGTGTGLIMFAAACAVLGLPFAAALVLGLMSVGCGLTMVLLEIGRPWRAFNVFFHPQTSWMTREGVMALPLFASGGLALLLHWADAPAVVVVGLALIAGLSAGGFLYCQARILRAAKGIPAWREPTLTPFIITTGLAEGSGILAALAALGLAPGWAALPALVLAAGRVVAWQKYSRTLASRGAPDASLAALDRLAPRFLLVGHGIAALLLAAAIALPTLAWAAGLGGLLLTGAGWWAKLTIVTRAAATQGFAIPRTPVRGRGVSRAVAKPGWQTP